MALDIIITMKNVILLKDLLPLIHNVSEVCTTCRRCICYVKRVNTTKKRAAVAFLTNFIDMKGSIFICFILNTILNIVFIAFQSINILSQICNRVALQNRYNIIKIEYFDKLWKCNFLKNISLVIKSFTTNSTIIRCIYNVT